MKAILGIVLAAVLGSYGFGFVTLSERGATRFLEQLENLSLQGRSAEYCAHLHQDLAVSIRDRSADPPAEFDGNREDFCDYVTQASRTIGLLGVSMQVKRDDFTITRDWLHPWTVRVSYREDRVTTMSRAQTTLHTRGEDHLTLVQTFDGVKLRQLDSHSWLAE
jgi:hypothetical protein